MPDMDQIKEKLAQCMALESFHATSGKKFRSLAKRIDITAALSAGLAGSMALSQLRELLSSIYIFNFYGFGLNVLSLILSFAAFLGILRPILNWSNKADHHSTFQSTYKGILTDIEFLLKNRDRSNFHSEYENYIIGTLDGIYQTDATSLNHLPEDLLKMMKTTVNRNFP
jgi:hypothetical protein